MEDARGVRGGRVHRRACAVDQRQRHRRAAMAFRPVRSARHPALAVPRRSALDRDARRRAHRVGPVAARALAAVVVDAAAGLRAHSPRRQRRGAGALVAGAGGRLVRRRTGGAGGRHARPRGAARRRGPGPGPPRIPGIDADGGAPRRARAAGSVGRVGATRSLRPSSSCTARISAVAGRCANSGAGYGCATAKPHRCRSPCAAPSSIAR